MIITIVTIINRPRIKIKRYRVVKRLKIWDLRKLENIQKIPNFTELLPSA